MEKIVLLLCIEGEDDPSYFSTFNSHDDVLDFKHFVSPRYNLIPNGTEIMEFPKDFEFQNLHLISELPTH